MENNPYLGLELNQVKKMSITSYFMSVINGTVHLIELKENVEKVYFQKLPSSYFVESKYEPLKYYKLHALWLGS